MIHNVHRCIQTWNAWMQLHVSRVYLRLRLHDQRRGHPSLSGRTVSQSVRPYFWLLWPVHVERKTTLHEVRPFIHYANPIKTP